MTDKKATTTKALTRTNRTTEAALPGDWADRKSRAIVKDGVVGIAAVSAILAPYVKLAGPNGEVQNLSTSVAQEMVASLMADVQPTSTIERMLVEQLAITHAQAIRIHHSARAADQYDRIEQMLNVASRLQADFRKTVMTLKELRAPARQFIVAQQANIAQQQVVNQNPATLTNGQGAKDA